MFEKIKSLSHLQEQESNPFKYLFCVSILYLLCLTYPQQIGWGLILALSCAILFIIRPLLGVFFIVAVHPMMSCSFEIFWTFGNPIESITSTQLPYGGFFLSPLTKPVTTYPFQILSLLLIPSLLFHCKPFSDKKSVSQYQKIIYTIIPFFFLYEIAVSLQSTYADKSLFFLSRFASILIIIIYLSHFITNGRILRSLMTLHCCAAVILALLAYYGTYYGFEKISYIWCDYGLTIIQKQSLFNGANSYNSDAMGMLPGSGLSAKHQLSIFLVEGIFFATYLLITAKNKAFSWFCISSILFFYTTLYYGPSKLSLVGIFISCILITVLYSRLRPYIAVIVLFVLLLNIFGLAASTYLRPRHAKITAGSTQNFKVVNDDSEFSMSLKGRLAIMRKAAKRILQSHGIGIGSGMLSRDPLFPNIHGHNFFITLFAECGFPAVICALTLGILLFLRVKQAVQKWLHDYSITPVTVLTASFLAIFFEYSFDTFVWTPQLWVTGSLLWISTRITVNKNQPV